MSDSHSASGQAVSDRVDADSDSIVLILPGRSSWHPDTAADLEKFAPELIQQVNSLTGLDAAEICRRPSTDLNPLPVVEPVSYLLNFAYARELQRRGVKIEAVAGYSLGEFAALAFAGSLDFGAGLRLVKARADLISQVIEKNPLRIVRVEGADPGVVTEICEEQGDVWPATYDSPHQMMVGGEPRAIDRLAPKLKDAGAERIVLVLNNGGLHTPPMEQARDAIAAQLADVEIAKPEIPVVSSISAQFEDDPERWRGLLADQVYMPVRWRDALPLLPRACALAECGGGQLAELSQQMQPDRRVFVIDSIAALDAAAEQLSGAISA
ncbi:MAG: ACP S-malonyltransferase [Solirubrobacterales bacterium]